MMPNHGEMLSEKALSATLEENRGAMLRISRCSGTVDILGSSDLMCISVHADRKHKHKVPAKIPLEARFIKHFTRHVWPETIQFNRMVLIA